NYMQQTNYIQAQQHFEVATTADPSNIWYQDALLNCLIKQDNYHAAVSVAESLLSMDKDYYKVLAEIYIELGQWVQAKKIIEIGIICSKPITSRPNNILKLLPRPIPQIFGIKMRF